MKSLDLRTRWRNFIQVVFDPIFVFLLATSVIVFLVSIAQTQKSFLAFFNVLLAVSTGLAGGILAKRWDDIRGEGIIQARGTVSVRSLNLLLSHINRLHRRTKAYLADAIDGDQDQIIERIVVLNLREVLDRSEALMEEVLSSIQNWTDIVPEANVDSQFDLISQYRNQVEQLEDELSSVMAELEQADKASESKLGVLEKTSTRLRSELENARAELRQKQYEVRPTYMSTGSILSSDVDVFTNINPVHVITTCPNCRHLIATTDEKWTCPSCGYEHQDRPGSS